MDPFARPWGRVFPTTPTPTRVTSNPTRLAVDLTVPALGSVGDAGVGPGFTSEALRVGVGSEPELETGAGEGEGMGALSDLTQTRP